MNRLGVVHLQKAKQLTAADGHIMLLEYMEEHPLLLSRPGASLPLLYQAQHSLP